MTTLFSLTRPAVDPLSLTRKVMAVDFGAKGGFAWNEGGALLTMEMPKDRTLIRNLLGSQQPSVLVGEDVHAFPGQGVVSVATFMRDAGTIDGVCMAFGIKQEFILPQEWTKWYGIGKSGDFKSIDLWKKHLMAHAQELFPRSNITQNVADAVLLWNFYNNPERIRKVKPPSFR